MLRGKHIVLGVTGGIAAYKACELVSSLRKLGAEVRVIMTKSAQQFVTPKSFEILSKNEVNTDMFAPYDFDVEHVSLAKWADAFVIAPATANIIGKIANGIADDMLSTTIMATKAPKIIAPAMNTAMYENSIFQKNLAVLVSEGFFVIEPTAGHLACGDNGKGRLAPTNTIIEALEQIFLKDSEAGKSETIKNDFAGQKVLVTAGGTQERIDAVRCISNFSSGKMGMAIAVAAAKRGAEVTLVLGVHTAEVPPHINTISATTAEEMFNVVMSQVPCSDIIIKAAAVGDYRAAEISSQKIKDKSPILHLTKNKDIAKEVGKIKGDKKLVIFCAETENLEKNANKKLVEKNADMVVANDVSVAGAGFDVDTNKVLILDKNGKRRATDTILKTSLADIILDETLKL